MIAKKFLKSKPVCKATFTLPAEAAQGAKKVFLVGDFNNWDTAEGIKHEEAERWHLTRLP